MKLVKHGNKDLYLKKDYPRECTCKRCGSVWELETSPEAKYRGADIFKCLNCGSSNYTGVGYVEELHKGHDDIKPTDWLVNYINDVHYDSLTSLKRKK